MPTSPDVVALLRNAISQGLFAPGQRLIEADLAQEYDASRFTVRNALLQLASEGLVELQPNRGARVRAISPAEAIEITEVRQAVERLIASRAAVNVTDEQITFLRQLGLDMQAAVANNELLRYSELNSKLHATLHTISAHQTAGRILEQLNAQVVRHQFQLFLVPGRPSVSLPEHLAIIESVCARDPESAGSAMATHVGSVISTLTSMAERSADRN